jgi:cyclophilin family peptidyl-prolyl cis-trans isomerase
MTTLLRFLAIVWLTSASWATAADNPRVRFVTSMGDFVVELYPDKAPRTVANFMQYVRGAFYDDTIFHRVVRGFVIQGGGYTADGQAKPTGEPVINESDNGLSNLAGTIAMARAEDPDSATSQFFINTADNVRLDAHDGQPGYTVFGKVVEGMDVIQKIDAVEVGPDMYLGPHRPLEDIVILRARPVWKKWP